MQPIYLPLVRQSYDYSCGAASLASVLYYWGVWEGREPELYPLLDTTEYGTPGCTIMALAGSFGLSVTYEHNMTIGRLLELGEDGYTVILNIQAWGQYTEETDWSQIWDDGHYVVMVGIWEGMIYVMDPAIAGKYGCLPVEEFEKRWHDWSDDGESQEDHPGIIIRGNKSANGLWPILIS